MSTGRVAYANGGRFLDMTLLHTSIIALALASVGPVAATTSGHPEGPTWEVTATGTTAQLRGLSAVSARVAWASGAAGTVLRTVDGGRTWQSVGPPGTSDLQFRDIEALDARHAVILSIGEGEQSRIYVTSDGGASWTETFRNDEPTAFYDCLAFFDPFHGLALSDPVNGKFRILSTSDGGRSWAVLPDAGMPPALAGEFAFAASGTCLVTASVGPTTAWFATGGSTSARVFRTHNRGLTWTATNTPIPSSAAGGVFSLAFRDPWRGIAVGGDFLAPTAAPDGSATTVDGGRTWTTSPREPGEYRSAVAWIPRTVATAVTVGPTGSDLSRDGGRRWTRFDTSSFDAVSCARDGACWASGAQGRVARLHR
jgi:photosystem II stability/assembly factor-like uncharacterized protein